MSGTYLAPVLEDTLEFRATDATPAEQAVDLARLLRAKLPGMEFDEAVVRTAGTSPVARRNRAQFSRAHAEGAVIYVLREHIGKPIATGDPKSFATRASVSKDDFVAKADGISASKKDAFLAALSVLPNG